MTAERMQPVGSGERITVIDTLRGAALFGILVANMRGFSGPAEAYFDASVLWKTFPDRLAQIAIDVFVMGKFITIFATLFGIGFAIQMERAMAKGQSVAFYAKRLGWLLAIGALHVVLFWWGDILVTYAVSGFALLAFRRSSERQIWWFAILLYWLPVVMFASGVIASMAGAPMPDSKGPTAESIAKTIEIYAHGSVAAIVKERLREWRATNGAAVFFIWRIIGTFLIGLLLWRKGVLRDLAANSEWWRKAQLFGLAIGLPGNLAVGYIEWVFHPEMIKPTPMGLLLFAISSLAVPALSLFYAATVVRLWQSASGQRWLKPFSYVGRMALTNYLLQSVICTTLYYSYGGGLFGKVGPLMGLAPTLIVYALQVPFSAWWLRNHAYGPMEWVWRRLTYGAVPDKTREAAA